MPTIDYTCPQCSHRFKRMVMRGDPVEPAPCPVCGMTAVPPSKGPEALFEGISGFSKLAGDTN
jgi:putative FmdB family regulatory protein